MEISYHKRRCEALEEENKEVKTEFENVLKKIKEAESEIDYLKKKNSNFTGEKMGLQNEVKKLSNELESYNTRLAEE